MQRALPYFATGIGLMMAGLALGGAQALGLSLDLVGAAAFLTGLFVWIKPVFAHDPYDLNRLLEVHEEAKLEGIDATSDPESDSIVCARCGTVYNVRLPVCPNCRH